MIAIKITSANSVMGTGAGADYEVCAPIYSEHAQFVTK